MPIFIFDLDDTLYNQMEAFNSAFHYILKDTYDFDMKEFFVRTRVYSDEVFDKLIAGEITIEESGYYRIVRTFEDYDVKIDPQIAKDIQERYFYNQHHVVLEKDKEEVLNYLKENHIKFGLLTNGPGEHQRIKIDQMHLPEIMGDENIFVSGEIGASKPELKAFEIVENAYNASKDEFYYVGDSLKNDGYGPKAAGWHSIWLNRRDVEVTDEMKEKLDYIVGDNDSLLEVVKNIVENSK